MTAPLAEISPAERRRQRVRGAIIAAAEKVFSREGEVGLSIRRLAEEIDYSPSAIYKYFGSKEELLEELKEVFFERLLSRVDDAQCCVVPFHAMSFEERSRACLTTYIDVATERPYHYAAAFSSLPEPDTPRETAPISWDAFNQTRKGQAFGILLDMVAEGQAGGYFDPSLDHVRAAKSVWASLHGLALLLINLPHFPEMMPQPRRDSRDEFIAFHAGMILRSLGYVTPVRTDTATSSDPHAL